MYATIRRYDGTDQARSRELTGKVNEKLVPKLRELPGFVDYYFVESGDGSFTSLGVFQTAEQGAASSELASGWIKDEHLESLIPNAPKITTGEVVAHGNGVTVA